MKLLDLTLPSPAENLALDEALLQSLETDPGAPEVLRLWESPELFVVLGRSSRRAEEVNLEYCARHSVPVLRRCSGGGTVVAGPGCLMYAVVLRFARREQLRQISEAHRFVMERIRSAVERTGTPCAISGISDLAVGSRKISGNALRSGRHGLLYHGTLLYGMNGETITACLGQPARQPEYRQQRGHAEFVTSLPVNRTSLEHALRCVWHAHEPMVSWPAHATGELGVRRYLQAAWNGYP
jgi:lipoate---protein ligase